MSNGKPCDGNLEPADTVDVARSPARPIIGGLASGLLAKSAGTFLPSRNYSALVPGMIEFGSAGLMRQSRVLASLARENSPAHIRAAIAAGAKVAQKAAAADARSLGNLEKMRMTRANKFRVAGYQARLGLPPGE